MRTKLDELKKLLRNIEKEEARLSTANRSLSSITDLELSLGLKTLRDRKIQLLAEIEKVDV